MIEGPFEIEYKYTGVCARSLEPSMDSCGSVCLGIVGSELQRSANNVKGHGNKNIVIIMQRLLAEQSPGRAELS